MPHYLDRFIDKKLERLSFINTGNCDDIELSFSGSQEKLVVSHTFAIPFCVQESGIKRFKNWIKPVPEWSEKFVGNYLICINYDNYENNFYLEFEGKIALLINKNLITTHKKQKRVWTSYDSESQ